MLSRSTSSQSKASADTLCDAFSRVPRFAEEAAQCHSMRSATCSRIGLQSIYCFEKQLPKMAKAATTPDQVEALAAAQ